MPAEIETEPGAAGGSGSLSPIAHTGARSKVRDRLQAARDEKYFLEVSLSLFLFLFLFFTLLCFALQLSRHIYTTVLLLQSLLYL
jgi:hypothetical protein